MKKCLQAHNQSLIDMLKGTNKKNKIPPTKITQLQEPLQWNVMSWTDVFRVDPTWPREMKSMCRSTEWSDNWQRCFEMLIMQNQCCPADCAHALTWRFRSERWPSQQEDLTSCCVESGAGDTPETQTALFLFFYCKSPRAQICRLYFSRLNDSV